MEAKKRQNFYTPNGWQGENYDGNLTVKEITAKIREYCKKQFPDCKFSVTKDGDSLTSSIHISLMEAPEDVFTNGKDYIQVNEYYIKDDERITDYGKNVLSSVYNFSNSFNYDDSDSMIDYFDRRFYLHLNIGKWDKPFKVVPKTEKTAEKQSISGIEIIDYSEKAIAVIGETKPIKDQLKDLGGRFNFRLSCGAGWIFPKTKKEEVIQLLTVV